MYECFDPAVMLTYNKQDIQQLIKKFLGGLMDMKVLDAQRCDAILAELAAFYSNVFIKLWVLFENLNKEKDGLDNFWFKIVKVCNYLTLGFVAKFILILSLF